MVEAAVRVTQPRFVLVMGVCGVGKSTIAKELAYRAGGLLVEADDHHSVENKQVMANGQPLSDEQRWPWLKDVVRAATNVGQQTSGPVFVACSALKRCYRDFLRERLKSLSIVYLTGEPGLIRRRLEERRSHFMPPHLLDSQLADLEEPGPDEAAVAADIGVDPKRLAETVCAQLGLVRPDGR